MVYLIFSAYYKYGEVDLKQLNTDDEFRQYVIDMLTEYWQETEITPEEIQEYYDYEIDDLISIVLEQSAEYNSNNNQWQIKNIVKCQNPVIYDAQ